MRRSKGFAHRASVVVASALVLCAAPGCSSDSEGAPCGGESTCPDGFSCQDRGGGYRCHERELDASLQDTDDGGRRSGQSDGGLFPAPGVPGADGAGSDREDGGIDQPVERDGSVPAASLCENPVALGASAAPNVVFVIDGSGSMCDAFGGSTRWQVLRSALLDSASGVIPRLQSRVAFGTQIYDGTIDLLLATTATGGTAGPVCAGIYTEMRATGSCPNVISVAPALDNAAAIEAAYPATELGGSTPTDKVITTVVDTLLGQAGQSFIVLATDGLPNDICVGGVGGDSAVQQQLVIAAVDRAADAGIKTLVISLAGGSADLQAHLDEVAQHGDPADAAARSYAPTSPNELIEALEASVSRVACKLTLDDEVRLGDECRGSVEINGTSIPCCTTTAAGIACDGHVTAAPDGFRMTSSTTLELLGSACTATLLSNATVEARFPCMP